MKDSLLFSSHAVRRMTCLLTMLAVLGLASVTCSAAAGVFMKLDGVDTWSALTGASSVMTAAADAEPAAASSLSLAKRPDRVSPLLLQACGDGTPLRRLTLAWRDGAGTVFRITLENVFVARFTVKTDEGSPPLPVEEWIVRFAKAEWSWFGSGDAEQTAGGRGVQFDALTKQAAEKTYQPFRAAVERRAGQQPGLRLTCPVERGRTYRVSASAALDGQWTRLDEFTAAEDGVMERTLTEGAGRLFLRVEALD